MILEPLKFITMEFYKDLVIAEKSKFRIITGIVYIIISVAWITIKIKEGYTIRPFDWIYSGFFSLSGVLKIIGGTGVLYSIFGKPFIFVDNNKISIKPRVFSKEEQISWNEISNIDHKVNRFIFNTRTNNSITLQLSKLDYSSNIEIKNIISEISKKKGIKIK